MAVMRGDLKIRSRDSDAPVHIIFRSRLYEQVYWQRRALLIRGYQRAVRREADAGGMAPKMLFAAWDVWHLIMSGRVVTRCGCSSLTPDLSP